MRAIVTFAGLAMAATVFGNHGAQAAARPACFPVWNANTVYNPSDQNAPDTASQFGVNYKANYWTENQDPEDFNGTTGQPWTQTGICHACEVAPAKPTDLTAVATSDTQTDLIWSSSNLPVNCKVAAYHVFQDGTEIGTSTGNNFSVGGLTPKKTYSFTVVAKDTVGSSDPSDPFSVTTAAAGQGRGAAKVFAPYIDMSPTLGEQLVSIMKRTGLKSATLAFILAPNNSGQCTASWGGTIPVDHDVLANGSTIRGMISRIHAAGNDVILSFGGENGAEPAITCTTVASLRHIYQNVINRYKATSLDFDIEGASELNLDSVALRAKTLRAIKKANPNVLISYTLAVTQDGLDDNGLKVLTTSKANGFEPDIVNIMAMDYTVNVDDMGHAAITAANGTAKQLQQLGMTARIGVTPMLGVNDSNNPKQDVSEVFGIPDARELLKFAEPNPDIARIGMWSVNRDNGGCPTEGFADASCSGLQQTNFQFIRTLNAFSAPAQ